MSFCSCTDTKCPLNPVNHDKGCDLCIQKCLKDNEIPSCFFNKVNKNVEDKDYTFMGFAKHVQKNM